MAKHIYRFQIYQPNQAEWRGSAPTLLWQPHVDVYRSEGELLIQVEAPGVEESSLRLLLESGQLMVEGQRQRPEMPPSTRCLCMEIEYGSFQRAIALPPDAHTDAIEARYESGILTIKVPVRRSAPSVSVRVSID